MSTTKTTPMTPELAERIRQIARDEYATENEFEDGAVRILDDAVPERYDGDGDPDEAGYWIAACVWVADSAAHPDAPKEPGAAEVSCGKCFGPVTEDDFIADDEGMGGGIFECHDCQHSTHSFDPSKQEPT